ncbi:RasGAP-activating-like protein 1 [Acipenser ruthenus]|uniref:RasGAP-activating-like protein 1 n=1 Tax=Acipenser ruthenus TaxID=7906 RepID=A0A662YP17_ACIRT|nr:RasGAP-activating-like protein 1 [Acipenser ruthenus]
MRMVRSSIPVQRICAVERVDENAFQQQNMMQVVTQDNDGQLHTMYILCKNVNALNQWLSSIRKASIYNERMLPSFHPGAYRSGKWSCCLQSNRTVLGCSRTHSAVTLGDWSDPLDPDAETQTIYRQLLQGRDKLRSVSARILANLSLIGLYEAGVYSADNLECRARLSLNVIC